MGFWSSLWNGVKAVGNAVIGSSGSIGSSAVSSAAALVSNDKQMKYQKELYALQNKYNVASAQKSYEYSLALQNSQNAYNTQMSNSAYQRSVQDLRKAGINPMLTIMNGGASTPASGGAVVGVPGVSGGSAPDVDYLGSALAVKNYKMEKRQKEYQNDFINAQTGTELEKQKTQEQQTELFAQQIADLKNQMANRDISTAANVKRMETMNLADIINAYTNQTVGSAQAKYTNERARGFSNSWSNTDSYNEKSGTPVFNKGAGWSSGTTYSRSW